jgi:hypothetical protein
MTRRIEQLSIDGVTVDLSKARFADTFDVAERDERNLAYDEEVVWVVIAHVSAPSFRETKQGDLTRVNVLKVKEARLLRDANLQASVLDKLGFDFRPQASLFEEVTEKDPTPKELSDSGVRLLQTLESDAVVEPDISSFEGGWDDEVDWEGDEELDRDLALVGAIAESVGANGPREEEDIYHEIEVVNGRRRFRQAADEDPALARFLGT